MTPIEQAVKIAGSKSALGRLLDVSHETVRKWVSGETPVSAERAREIEQALNGKVSRVGLVFPEYGANPVLLFEGEDETPPGSSQDKQAAA